MRLANIVAPRLMLRPACNGGKRLAAESVLAPTSRRLPATIQGMIVRLSRGGSSDAIAPIWEGVTILRDPYTEHAKRQISISATMFWNFGIARADGFKWAKSKLA